MQSLSVFLNIIKVADFRWKNTDVSRNEGGVSCDLYIFFDLLYKYAKFHYCTICLTDFRQGAFSLHPWAALKKPILNRVKTAAFLDNNWKSFFSSSLIPFPTKVCGDVPLSSLEEYLESYRGWQKVYNELKNALQYYISTDADLGGEEATCCPYFWTRLENV